MHYTNFSQVQLPLKTKLNLRTRCCTILDKGGCVVVENLPEDIAELIVHAINNIGEATALLKVLLDFEKCMIPDKKAPQDKFDMRCRLIDKIKQFLDEKIGYSEDPQDYQKNFEDWGKNLMSSKKVESYFKDFNIF